MIAEFQSDFIFPVHAVPDAGPLPHGAERLSVTSEDGARLEGILIPSDHRDQEKRLILGFGGNAWNGQDVAVYLHEVYPDHDVVVFHYRGYRPSTGSPSGASVIADAPLVYDAAVRHTRAARVIAVGFSIGSAIAAQLALERKVDGLILVTPFDSLKAVAQSMVPWLPIGPFFKHEIDAVGALRKAKVPVAIIAAEHDEIVPRKRTDALRSEVRTIVFDQTISRSGHNDIYARSDFHDAMREALACLEG